MLICLEERIILKSFLYDRFIILVRGKHYFFTCNWIKYSYKSKNNSDHKGIPRLTEQV